MRFAIAADPRVHRESVTAGHQTFHVRDALKAAVQLELPPNQHLSVTWLTSLQSSKPRKPAGKLLARVQASRDHLCRKEGGLLDMANIRDRHLLLSGLPLLAAAAFAVYPIQSRSISDTLRQAWGTYRPA
jgi:hypothetical protein